MILSKTQLSSVLEAMAIINNLGGCLVASFDGITVNQWSTGTIVVSNGSFNERYPTTEAFEDAYDEQADVASYMTKPIATAEEANAFIRALHADGKLFHFDDSPETIISCKTNEACFTAAECLKLRARVAEMFTLRNYDPFELAVELL